MTTHCIKCKFKRASATPSLCLGCFTRIAWEYFVFSKRETIPFACYEMRDNAVFKNWMNRLQRKIRKSHKLHDSTIES